MLSLRRKVSEEVFIDGGRVRVVVADIFNAAVGLTVIEDDQPRRLGLAENCTFTVLGGRCLVAIGEIRPGYGAGSPCVTIHFSADPSIVIDREEVHVQRHEIRFTTTEGRHGSDVTAEGQAGRTRSGEGNRPPLSSRSETRPAVPGVAR